MRLNFVIELSAQTRILFKYERASPNVFRLHNNQILWFGATMDVESGRSESVGSTIESDVNELPVNGIAKSIGSGASKNGVLNSIVSRVVPSSSTPPKLADEMGALDAVISHVPSDGATKIVRIPVYKRPFDILGAVTIGILSLPIIVSVAVAIRLSGSPVVFEHTRIGLNREKFGCLKFRSMIPDAERVLNDFLLSNPKAMCEWNRSHKLANDPRVTRFGNFLRKCSLDELPQLWNVIRGDMSLVGPRPIVADELDRYGNKAQMYCSVRPGITGLWQTMGRSKTTYSRRVSMDTLYVRRQGLLLDLWVLAKTMFVVVKRVGAV